MTRLRLVRRACALLGALAIGTSGIATPATPTERDPTWASLTPAQKQTLAPLQRDWPSIDPNRKQKWLEVALRFPALPPAERLRVQERMAEWARLTPAERTRARLQFQEVRQLPAEEREAKWQAYQALPESERQNLAQRAKPAAKAASAAQVTGKGPATSATAGKHNLVAAAPPPATRAVAPIVVQAKPGATTTTLSARGPKLQPPAGQPKIAATAGNVDPATLLPRRGPQGPASASHVAEQR